MGLLERDGGSVPPSPPNLCSAQLFLERAVSQPSVVHVGLGSTLFYCTFLSLLCGQCGLSHSCTVPSFSSQLLLAVNLYISLFIVQSTWCLPPLHSPSPCPSGNAPRNPPNPLPGPAPISVPTGVGRKGSAVPTRPSTAQLLCPWLQGVEVREGSASAALELWLRMGWTCWCFPWFLSVGTVERCGVGLGGLSNTQAPSGVGRRPLSPPRLSFLFFAQESSESTNTTIEDEDTKGTGGGTRGGGQAVSEVISLATPNEILAMVKPTPPSSCLRTLQKLL